MTEHPAALHTDQRRHLAAHFHSFYLQEGGLFQNSVSYYLPLLLVAPSKLIFSAKLTASLLFLKVNLVGFGTLRYCVV